MRGGCHCGAVEVTYQTELPVEKWWYGSVNLRVLDGEVSAPDTPFDYDGESTDDRIARRVQRWTPTTWLR